MKPAPLAAAILVVLIAPQRLTAAPPVGETYAVWGSDDFTIGPGDIRSDVAYHGTETLLISRRANVTRLSAHVSYTRDEGGARTQESAGYVSDLAHSGETIATANHDPDNLTVLNQPFTARLDAATLHDLAHLRGALPFQFPSPFTRSTLHGYLEHVGDARIAGRRTVGVRFEAAGGMHGALPDRPGMSLSGTIAMRGTALYGAESAVLLSLDTTVTVSGDVSGSEGRSAVKIVYRRTMRVLPRHAGAPIPFRRPPVGAHPRDRRLPPEKGWPTY